MTTLSESPRQQADREFESMKCPVTGCGKEKKAKTHFCNRCLWSLPQSMRTDLDAHRNDNEFALSHEEARDYLNAERRAKA